MARNHDCSYLSKTKLTLMKWLFMLLIVDLLSTNSVNAQGCIIVRNISGFGQYNFTSNSFTNSNWFLNITSRYFKSYRDFRGTTELKTPKDSAHSIRSFTTDFTLTRLFCKGWSLSLSLPISANSRTSKLDHGGIYNPAYTTRSFGIGDLRLVAY